MPRDAGSLAGTTITGRPAKPKAGCRVAAKAEVRAGKATSWQASAPQPHCGVPQRMLVFELDQWRHGTHERLHWRSRLPVWSARCRLLPQTIMMHEGESARSQILRCDQTESMFIDQWELYQRLKARLPDNAMMYQCPILVEMHRRGLAQPVAETALPNSQ